MSIVDKVIAAVTPPESDQARAEARMKARQSAQAGDWLSSALDHHEQIEAAFEGVKQATGVGAGALALRNLAQLLTAHSMAEEAVLYPALAQADEKAHAVMAYTEQSAAKLQLGVLEYLPPGSQEFRDKLEHIRGAVAHHVYEEESKWFLQIVSKIHSTEQTMLTRRYQEEFGRYFGELPEEVPGALVGAKAQGARDADYR